MKYVAKSAANERRAESARRKVLRHAIADGNAQPLPHLTGRQAICLRWIFDYSVANLVYPTQREITELMGSSLPPRNTIRPLVNKGYLAMYARAVRKSGCNIRLTRSGLVKLSLIGVDIKFKVELHKRALEGEYAEAE